MAENSKIEWTHHTFNPWRGCTKVAAGCANCYADSQAKRNPQTLGIWGDGGTRVVASETMWQEPVKWNAAAKAAGERHRVFCASMADVFEDWGGPLLFSGKQPIFVGKDFRASRGESHRANLSDVRARLFALIDATPHLDWLLLTKRPENIPAMWPAFFPGGYIAEAGSMNQEGPRSNVWLGTSIACKGDLKNIDELRKCRDLSPVLFLSVEPLLQDLGAIDLTGIDWVIVGGESGPHARPMHPAWARSLRDQCQAAGVPYLFKQWGEFLPSDHCPQAPLVSVWHQWGNGEASYRVGKKAAGRLLDGREWSEFPAVEATA